MSAYLAEILAITFTGFAAVYPLLLWLTPRTLIDGGFYRFNQGMVSIVGEWAAGQHSDTSDQESLQKTLLLKQYVQL